MKTVRITRPDDWHVHLREGASLRDTVKASSEHFGRVLAMPNLMTPLTTMEQIQAYHGSIVEAIPEGKGCVPYCTLYLNDEVTEETLTAAKKLPYVLGAKLYPQGATTHSAKGAASIQSLYPLFEVMQSLDMVLQIHGETPKEDIFSREQHFLRETLSPLIKQFPKLRIVLEHISTKEAVIFVEGASEKVAATITPHHLIYDRNHLLSGGIKPHLYCLPILKTKDDRLALIGAAISGNPKFFAGTDSAPHPIKQKESVCGCAGIYSAPYALSYYAKVFDDADALPLLEGFTSHFGADFYQLSRNHATLNLEKRSYKIPEYCALGEQQVVPMGAGETVEWSVVNE